MQLGALTGQVAERFSMSINVSHSDKGVPLRKVRKVEFAPADGYRRLTDGKKKFTVG